MKLLFLFWPPAVWKMTVWHELEKVTSLKLFHNHITIELAKNFLDFWHPHFGELVQSLRIAFFEVIAKTDITGIIFTAGIDFNDTVSINFMDHVCTLFAKYDAEIFHVELITDLATRLERNKSEHRLRHKPSKSDIILSEARMLQFEKECRFNTLPGEFNRTHYFQIDTTHISAEETAQKICTHFNWQITT